MSRFRVLFCISLFSVSYSLENDVTSQLLKIARSHRKKDKMSSEAVNRYMEIINSQSNHQSYEAFKNSPDHMESSNLRSDSYVEMLEDSRRENNRHLSDALFELSEILESKYWNVNSMSDGFEYLVRAAEMGHVKAQHRLAGAYATGIYGSGLVPMDAGRALLLEYLSALGGNPEAAMGMGYRYIQGIGVPENCEMASNFYEYAANEAAEAIRRRGQPVHSERVRISDIELGASTGRREIDVEVIDYYKHLVSAGSDTSAAYTLGVMFMQGSRFIEQDVVKAIFYLEIAAEAGNVPASGQLGYLLAQQLILKRSRREEKRKAEVITNSDNEEISKVSQNSANQDSDSETLMTEGLELKRITKLLKYASNRGDIFGQIGIGYLHLKGLLDAVSPSSVLNSKEVALKSKTESAIEKQNRNIAFAYNIFFKGQTKHPDAGFYMGEILMGRGLVKEASPNQGNLNPAEQVDVESTMDTSMEIGDDLLEPPIEFPIGIPPFKPAKNAPRPMAPDYLVVKPDPVAAVQAYAVSSQRGNLLALHRLSHLANQGLGMLKSCRTAMNGFKAVAERGDWGHELTKAHRLADSGKKASALSLFSRLAAIGAESAQFNTAYLLMRSPDLPWLRPPSFITAANSSGNVIEEVDMQGELQRMAESSIKKDQDTFTFVATGTAAYSSDLSLWEKKVNTSTIINEDGSQSFQLLPNNKVDCEARALALFSVSASQGNAEAFLRVGDCYYYGCAGLTRDKVEAAMFYQLAADLRNTHAIFNLGLMHEAGDGVQQDFHLAKRFYDQAAEVDLDARLPRAVALFVLSSHKSVQDYLGVEMTDKIGATAMNFLGGIEVEMTKVLGKDFSKKLFQMFHINLGSHLSSIGRSDFTPSYRDIDGGGIGVLKGLQGSVKRFFISIGAQTVSVVKEREGLGECIALLSLIGSFLFIMYWRRTRQDQRR